MSIAVRRIREAVELSAFGHYVRTGHRADIGELTEAVERKFNPYHDRLGRFTFTGGEDGASGSPVANHSSRARTHIRSTQAGAARGDATPAAAQSGGFQSDYVRNAVSPITNNADTYFELNKRQAQLDGLRANAGSNPPATVKADLDEIQRRLDSNRKLLDQRYNIADQNVSEILRAGLAPFDTAAGALNIANGKGELRDYLAVASVIPVGGTLGKFAKLAKAGKASDELASPATHEIIQLGGAHRVVRKLRGYHSHHLVAGSISPLSKGEGPAIAMLREDHFKTASFGGKGVANTFRAKQAKLIANGNFKGALQMGIDDIRGKFGNRYNGAIEQALTYSRSKGH